MRAPRWLVGVTAGVLLAACSGTPGDDEVTAPAEAPTTRPTASPTSDGAAGDAPPERPTDAANELLAFTGRQLDGGTFDGAAVTGDVVVWFWAPW